MHLFINALAATAGGGLTYIRNIIPHLAVAPGLQVTVLLGTSLGKEFQSFDSVQFVRRDVGTFRRFWYEQWEMPGMIESSGADVLLSAGNFALRKSPVPQILLSRNSIYISPDYSRDLRTRHEYRAWLDLRLRSIFAKKSIHWADVTVAPSRAFATELSRWSGAEVRAIHHGFDKTVFTQDPAPLDSEVAAKIAAARGCLKLLFVSHYNYYRNFETLLRALPILRERAGPAVRLFLTCHLETGKNPGAYCPDMARELVRQLDVSHMVVELGTVPYRNLHRVYGSADVYVSPAYTETFAHPLVEAMASRVPVAASDITVHREICGDAALYFERFSPEALAETIMRIAGAETRSRMVAEGLRRVEEFSWKVHVDQILDLARELVNSKAQPQANAR